MAKKKDNYLDYIPRPNTLFECNKNKDGKIEIYPGDGAFEGDKIPDYEKTFYPPPVDCAVVLHGCVFYCIVFGRR